jgi:hypothetical protein
MIGEKHSPPAEDITQSRVIIQLSSHHILARDGNLQDGHKIFRGWEHWIDDNAGVSQKVFISVRIRIPYCHAVALAKIDRAFYIF